MARRRWQPEREPLRYTPMALFGAAADVLIDSTHAPTGAVRVLLFDGIVERPTPSALGAQLRWPWSRIARDSERGDWPNGWRNAAVQVGYDTEAGWHGASPWMPAVINTRSVVPYTPDPSGRRTWAKEKVDEIVTGIADAEARDEARRAETAAHEANAAATRSALARFGIVSKVDDKGRVVLSVADVDRLLSMVAADEAALAVLATPHPTT